MNKYQKLFLLIITSIIITGCWNYRELNDLGIVSAVFIKKDDGVVYLTIQIINVKKSDSGSGSSTDDTTMPVTTINSQGKTIHEAMRNSIKHSPKKPYIGHMDILIIDQETAENGIGDILDFFLRDSESRKEFKIIIAKKNEEEEILEIITPLEGLPSKNILSSLEANAQFVGETVIMNYDEFISIIHTEGSEAYAPAISVIGDPNTGASVENLESTKPTGNFDIDGIAAFKGTKLVGFLDSMESLGVSFINNNITNIALSFSCDKDNYAVAEINDSKSNIDVEFENNLPKIKISNKITAFLTEINCKQDITKQEVLKNLEKSAKKRIEEIIGEAINKVQNELQSDIIGIGSQINKNYNNEWKKIKNNWDEIFPNVNFEIKTELTFTKKGEIIMPVEVDDIDI